MDCKSSCPICGSDAELLKEFKYIALLDMETDYTQKIYICDHCGFIFVGNPLSEENLRKKYNKNSIYEFLGRKIESLESKKNIDDGNRHCSFLRETLHNVNSVLEIGCASGYLLQLMKKNGKTVYGVEPSEKNVFAAKQNYDIDLYCGLFEDFVKSEQAGTYDLVIMSHVLEHLRNPVECISQIKSICNKYVFIEVPCLELKNVDQPYGFFCNEHFGYYSIQSLQYLMGSQGFSCKNIYVHLDTKYIVPSGFPAISTVWEKEDQTDFAEKNLNTSIIPADDVNKMIRRYMAISEEKQSNIRRMIKRLPNDCRGAIYGAGPITSKLFAETDLSAKNIQIIFDQDERKHGKEIAGVKVAPYEKKMVNKLGIKYILVSAFVAKEQILKNLTDLECKIITLF